MKRINIRPLQVKAVAIAMVILLGGFVGNQLSGDVWPNSKCKPSTTPVTTCGCPDNEVPYDRCEGTLPKIGNMYGGVTCQGEYNSTCDYTTQQNRNSCGRVVMCECLTCDTVLIMGCPNPCIVFEDKPHCPDSWGECTYSP